MIRSTVKTWNADYFQNKSLEKAVDNFHASVHNQYSPTDLQKFWNL